MKGFHHFVCECGCEIYFTNPDSLMIREWAKYHKPHMKKYLKAGSLEAALKMIDDEQKRS